MSLFTSLNTFPGNNHTKSIIIRNLKFSAVNIIAMLLFYGCSQKLIIPSDKITSAEVAESIIINNYSNIERFQADFRLKYKSGALTGNLDGTYQLEMPDKFAGSVNGLFGIKMGTLVVNADRYELEMGLFDFFEGNKDSLDIERLLGISLPMNDPVFLFSPAAMPPKDDAIILDFRISDDDSLWILEIVEDDILHRYSINQQLGAVVEERWMTAKRITLLEKKYRDFDRNKDLMIPSEMHLRSPGKLETDVTLQLSSVKVNPLWTENPFILKASQLP